MTVFPLVYLVTIRFPLLSARWRRNLLVHLIAVCLISVLHTTAIALYRITLFPPLGFGNESYGSLPVRYPMEFAHFFIYYWVGVSLAYLFHEIRFAREREVRQAKLETSLAQAQLQNLRLQLEPHFLFNALNAISAAIYEDPRVADEMIGRLGELLRQLFKEDRSQFVTMSREIELLQLYSRIMESRFEDRLQITVTIDDSAKQALVPQLILQPLVENGIRHGMNSHFDARIVIAARCENDSLLVTVRDHGPGIDESKPLTLGIGLGNTIKRLKHLYGSEQTFKILNAEDGGAIVQIRVPFRNSPAEKVVAPPSMAESIA